MMNPTRRKRGDSHYFTPDGKRYLLIDGPMPRRIDADARESTGHQYWHPADLRQVVEGIERSEPKKGLNPVTVLLLVIAAVALIVYAVLNY